MIDSGKKKQCRKGGGKRRRKGESENKAATENIIISYQSDNLTKKPSNTMFQTFEVPLAAQIYL